MAQPDLDVFAWVWNARHGQALPRLHRRIARWLQARGESHDCHLLLQAFRGAGKSTLVGLHCAWLLARRPDTRILVLAADHALATKMVASVRRIIERHPLCAHLRQRVPEVWAADRFTVQRPGALRDPSMLAAGIDGNITGSRADLIIGDDVEVAGNCDTPGKRAALRERLTEAEFVLVPGGTLLLVGTPHTAETLYAPDGFARGYASLRVPLLDGGGRSAWPERFTDAHVALLRDRVGPIEFRRQMQLEAVPPEAARLDPATLIRYAEETDYAEAGGRPVLRLMGRRLVSGGGHWDPAFGRPGLGDGSVLAACYVDGLGNTYLHRLHWLTHDPDAAIDPATQQCAAVARIARDLLLPAVRVETNGIGRFLPSILRQEMSRAGAACAVVEVAHREAKSRRILGALDPVMAARRLHIHSQAASPRFLTEMSEWRPDAPGAADDALDALAGCLAAEPVRIARLPPAAAVPGWRGA